jgi:four helix bundle protein
MTAKAFFVGLSAADSREQITGFAMGEGQQSRHFRNLLHWQKGQEVAVRVMDLVKDLPHGRASDILGAQILRSSGSVPANIAEGYGRFSKAAYRNHLSIARGSLFETQSWLDLLVRSRLVARDATDEIDGRCEELARILTARMKALESTNGRVRDEEAIYEVEDE